MNILKLFKKRISLQLLLWFLLLELPIAFILVYTSYQQAKISLEHEISDKLNSIAERQVLEISNYIRQEEIDMGILAQTGDIINAVNALNESYQKHKNTPSHSALVQQYSRDLAQYQRNFDFESIIVLNTQGEVAFTNSYFFAIGTNILRNSPKELAKLFERVYTLMQVDFSDFVSFDSGESYLLYGAAPIRSREGRFLGVVLVQLSNKVIEKIINNYTGMGKTGESMLFFKKESYIHFFTNSRFQKIGRENSLSYDPKLIPQSFSFALEGQRGHLEEKDHRNVPSIMKYAYVPALRAGIVVKINQEEAFEPVIYLRNMLLAIVMIATCIIVLVTLKLATVFTKPIRKLSHIVRHVAEGNFEVQATNLSQNEIGMLSHNLNRMVAILKQNKQQLEQYNQELETKVKERTNALEESLLQLQQQKEELLASEEELKQNAEELHVINEALSQKERRFRKIIEDNVVGMAVLSQEMIIFTNQSFTQALEYEPQEIFGKTLEEMVTPIYKNTFIKWLQTFEAADESQGQKASNRLEVKIYTKKRKTIWADLSLVKINFEGNDSILVNLIDITDKKNAELRIKESERKFKAIFENIQEGFLQVSEYGEILMANEQAAKMLGYNSAAELKGKIMQEDIYLDPKDRERMHAVMKKQKGAVNNYEVLLKKADGTPFVVEFDKHIVLDENGHISFVEGLFRDITERKMNEIALKETNEKLIESQEEITRNAEQLANANESLNNIINELKETNIQLEQSRKVIARQKANIERDNKILVQLAQNQAIQAGEWQEALQIITRVTSRRLAVERVGVWNIEQEPEVHLHCICLYDAEKKEYIAVDNITRKDYPNYFESILNGNIIDATDASNDKHTQEFGTTYFLAHEIKSTLDVPFFGGSGVAGVVCIEGKYIQRTWQPEDITFVKSIVDLVTIAYKSHQRRIAEEQLAEQTAIIQKKNEDIIDSINYASRIQDAILPTDNFIGEMFEEYFILFKPRDIVSGDFYWFGKIENKNIVAAVDCTGHGVPGAFMSMIGTQILNEIVNKRRVTKPHIILTELNKSIRRSLKQEDKSNRDGMDVAICTIDKQLGKVEFSGAKNPIVYIQNNKLFYVKGSKFAIGGEQKHEEKLFDLHTFDIDQPTYLYLFSDGYPDQFGGKEVRKFLISRLRNILFDIHQEPMIIQREILNNTIELWKEEGNQKQIDDILVVGLKIEKTST